MISPEQIKGARAMLDWSREMLAKEAGISPATVYNIEKGQRSIGSARKIRFALERKGFEFLGTKGLNRAEEKKIIYEGANARDEFYEDILDTAKKSNGDIIAVYRTPELLVKSLGIDDYSDLSRLDKLRKRCKIRCLLSNAQNAKLLTPQCELRSIPHHPFDPLALFICGDKYAIVTTNGREFSYFILKSIEIARSGAVELESHWKTALPFVAPDSQGQA